MVVLDQVEEQVAKMHFAHIMASSSKGAAHKWLKFHPTIVFNSVQVHENLARLGNSKCKPRCMPMQLRMERIFTAAKSISRFKVLKSLRHG